MKRVILLSVLLSSLALARYYEFDLEKVSDPFAQESYGIPQDHEVDLANVKVPWGLIGEAGWVQIGYEKDERLRIISLNENLTPREPEISIWKGRIFEHHRIWESTDLKTWTYVSEQAESMSLLMSQFSGPVFFRELCP